MLQNHCTTNLKESHAQQVYLFQLHKLLDIARRIGKPEIIYALQKLIVKHAGAK